MKSYYIEKAPILIGFKPSYHWAKSLFGIEGNTIISFVSENSHLRFPLDPEPEDPDIPYLQFIIEQFDLTPKEARLFQWYFSSQVCLFLGKTATIQGPDILNSGLPFSRNHFIYRPISSIIYLGLPLTPPKSVSKNPEKETELWYDEIKTVAITLMKHYTATVKKITFET